MVRAKSLQWSAEAESKAILPGSLGRIKWTILGSQKSQGFRYSLCSSRQTLVFRGLSGLLRFVMPRWTISALNSYLCLCKSPPLIGWLLRWDLAQKMLRILRVPITTS